MPRHQILIHGPHSEALVAALKPLAAPFYVVQTIQGAALGNDPWEEQCAVVLLAQELSGKARKKVQAYLEAGGRVVQVIDKESKVDGFHREIEVVSGDGKLVFRSNGTAYTPLANGSDNRIVQADVKSGKIILTTLSIEELGIEAPTLLAACGVDLPNKQETTSSTSNATARSVWSSVPPELLKPTHPLPQIMLVNPAIPSASLTLAWEIWADVVAQRTDEGHVRIDDENDAFLIYPPSGVQVEDVMRVARGEAEEGGVKKIVCPASLDAVGDGMPLFDAGAYFEHLTRLGRANGQRKGAAGEWNVGDVVLYGEAVTSTQTMLDKNPKILRALPTPFLSLATFQLSGRGRGTNLWLSPPGCLQFSLLFTLPRGFPAEKLVFVQYLAALAICDGLDGDGKLGVRVKWPNDIYAFAEGVGGGVEGVKGKAKLGGILVNSSFADGQWRVVVGCGINILNDLPTTSLAQLYDLRARRTGVQMKRPTMEGSLARVLVSFEGFWNTFVQDRGFDGLLDEYLGRWLHTDQQVTLTTTTPHQPLIIKTITLDHGLLRCVPDRRGEPRSMYDAGSDDRSSYGLLGRGMQGLGLGSKADQEYVDLQPDGNSFDLMSGLIKRKV